MARYELQRGGPFEMDGQDDSGNPTVVQYTAGSIIESEKPLDKLFPNRFINLDDPKREKKLMGEKKVRPSVRASPLRQLPNQMAGTPTNGPPRQDRNKAKGAHVKHGGPVGLQGRGDQPKVDEALSGPEEDEEDTTTADEGDEGGGEDEAPEEKVEKKRLKMGKAAAKDKGAEGKVGGSKLGDDVTAEFKKAGQADLKVFKKGKEFFLTDADATDTPLNEQGFTTKKQVDNFISTYHD